MRHRIRVTPIVAVSLLLLIGVPALAAAPTSATAPNSATAGAQRWATHRTDLQVAPLRLRPASPLRAGLASPVTASPATSAATTLYSGNWSGYQLSTLGSAAVPTSPTTFTSISGEWVVPTATQEVAGQAEYAATWIGIGGGNDVSLQPVGSPTLIQTGVAEQVSAKGVASYYAWYELIPETETQVTMPVAPGDIVRATISENPNAPGAWTITETDTTSGKSFTVNVTYPSLMDTAEWILEAPTIVGTGGTGEATLPNVGTVQFGGATVNGAPAALSQGFTLDMEPGNAVIADPSLPDSTGAGFNDCSYPVDNAAGTPTSNCPVPTSPL